MNKLARRMTFALCLLTLALPAVADDGIRTSGPAVTLEMRYAPGTTYIQTLALKQAATMPFAGAGEQKTTMTMVATMRAMKADAGGVRLEVGYDRVAMETAAMGQTMRYDSADESTHDSPLSMMGAAVGPKLTLTLDRDNNVTDIDGIEELMLAAGESGQMAKQMFGDEQFKRLADLGVTHLMPTGKVKPGDTWTSAHSLEAGPLGEMSYNSNNTFVGYTACGKRECAVIDSKGTIEFDAEALEGNDDPALAAMRAMGLEFEKAMTTGRMLFDRELGMVRTGETVVEMEMSMLPPGQDTRTTMTVNQTSTISIETR